MYRVFISLIGLFLCFPISNCVAAEDIEILQVLPMVECTNELLNREIIHYLKRQKEADRECYWNLTLLKDKDMYYSPVVYTCYIYRQADYIPDKGSAYLQYGNDVIVIKGKYNKSLFREIKGHDKSIKILNKRIPNSAHDAYLIVRFSPKNIFVTESEYAPDRQE